MCVICVSAHGVPQPSKNQIKTMFQTNPHGAGYMVARSGRVEIHKGFMTCESLLAALARENLTSDDAVVYHFRISTQAGVTPTMTHPFPLTRKISDCKLLDTMCDIGVAHNGVIRLTSDFRDREYNDTAHFIAEYLSYLVRNKYDMTNTNIQDAIYNLTYSRWAMLYKDGTVATVGNFIQEKNGLLFSNMSYQDGRKLQFTM